MPRHPVLAAKSGSEAKGVARPLLTSLSTSGVGLATSALGALIRTPLTIAVLGVAGFGVVATVSAVYLWMQMASASARLSGAAVASPLPHTADVVEEVSREVTRATLRLYAPYFALGAVAIIALPVQRLIDPTHQLTAFGVKLVLLIGMGIAVISVYGTARIACLNTFGSFRAQNTSMVSSFLVTSALTGIAYELRLSGIVFCTIWLISLAAPGLGMAGRLLLFRRPVRGTRVARPTVRILVSSGVWLVAGLQLASGLDLLIITGVLGSAEAGQYGLLWRVAQVIVVPVVGASPLVTRAAEVARTERSADAMTRCRHLLIALAVVEVLGVVTLAVASGPVFEVLGNGQVHLPFLLLMSGVAWCCLEVVRRLVVSLTSTPDDMVVWRRLSLITAVPNVVLSVAFTYWIGVAGPLLASVLGQLLLIAFAFRRVRTSAGLALVA